MVSAKVILLGSVVFSASALAGTLPSCQTPAQTSILNNASFTYTCGGNEIFSDFVSTSPNAPILMIASATDQIQQIGGGQESISVTLNFAVGQFSGGTFAFTYSVAPPTPPDVLVEEKDQISLVSTLPVYNKGSLLSIMEAACPQSIPLDTCNSLSPDSGYAVIPSQGGSGGTSALFKTDNSLEFVTTVQTGGSTGLSMFSETLDFVATTNSPEPSSILLMASGLAGCLLTCWKRRKKANR